MVVREKEEVVVVEHRAFYVIVFICTVRWDV